MKMLTVELDDEQASWLRKVAEVEGRTEADVVRDAILQYWSRPRGERKLAIDGVGRGPGGSIADIPQEELLKGFGE